MIAELKDRDKELNNMVLAHQKQLVAWEVDRQRVLTLEQRCARLESKCTDTDQLDHTGNNRPGDLRFQRTDT